MLNHYNTQQYYIGMSHGKNDGKKKVIYDDKKINTCTNNQIQSIEYKQGYRDGYIYSIGYLQGIYSGNIDQLDGVCHNPTIVYEDIYILHEDRNMSRELKLCNYNNHSEKDRNLYKIGYEDAYNKEYETHHNNINYFQRRNCEKIIADFFDKLKNIEDIVTSIYAQMTPLACISNNIHRTMQKYLNAPQSHRVINNSDLLRYLLEFLIDSNDDIIEQLYLTFLEIDRLKICKFNVTSRRTEFRRFMLDDIRSTYKNTFINATDIIISNLKVFKTKMYNIYDNKWCDKSLDKLCELNSWLK